MLLDCFEKACSSQGFLWQKIRLRPINALKSLIEHVWRVEIEQVVAPVKARDFRPSPARPHGALRRRLAALLR